MRAVKGGRLTLAGFVGAGLVVALALAFFVSPEASAKPDGLQKVANDHGFADRETPHAVAGAPTAGYAVKGIDDDRFSTGLAGVVGVAVVFAAGCGLFLVVRHRARRRTPAAGAG
jgi:cobalt/nickel transport system permease protein